MAQSTAIVTMNSAMTDRLQSNQTPIQLASAA